MRRKIRYYKLIWLKYDLPAGLTVFLVALPLCLGIALASGAPLYAGLLSGIIGGLIVSLLSGSQLSVSGPAAGLTTLVAASIISLADYKTFLLAVIVAGLLQLTIGILKFGAIARYFPSSVIKGMLAAIGIILIAKQIPIALGYDQPDFWTSGFPTLFSSTNFRSNFGNINQHISSSVLIISFISLGLLVLFQKKFSKKLKFFPIPLLIVIVGIGVNLFFNWSQSSSALKATQLVHIPSNIFSEITFPNLSLITSRIDIWKDGVTIGLLATLETLLCVEAVDKLDNHNRITPVNRELIAQGIGNITCGLLGAIPITAVVVRGAANAQAGGRTKLSAFTHGLFLLTAILLIPFVLNQIPFASLAAILMVTGFNLTKPSLYQNVWKQGWKQFLPFVITIIVILSTDLLIGVTTGLIVSVYFIVRNNFKAEYRINQIVTGEKKEFLIRLNSNVTFLNKVNLQKSLEKIPENSKLTVDGSECNFIDYDILEIISEFSNKAKDRQIELILKGIKKVETIAVH